MRRAAGYVALGVLLALAGCDDSSPPPIPQVDAGPRDAGRRDAGADTGVPPADAGDAAMTDDGGSDGGEPRDGGSPAADAGLRPDGGRDAGDPPELDGGPVPEFDGGPPPDPCDFVLPGPTCTPGGCPAGEVCLDNGCGETRCYPAGHPCGSDDDCPSTSSCQDGVCASSGGGCADSRDCPVGFACESGSCVDRRMRCGPGLACPHGFVCDSDSSRGAPLCVRAYTFCSSDEGCPLFGQCRDVLRDGSRICHWSGGPMCQNNDDCPVIGEVCGVHPIYVNARCGPLGPCLSDDDCASGYRCADLWGDGIRECVPPGGSCTRTADCTPPGVCGVLVDETLTITPPQCIVRPP